MGELKKEIICSLCCMIFRSLEELGLHSETHESMFDGVKNALENNASEKNEDCKHAASEKIESKIKKVLKRVNSKPRKRSKRSKHGTPLKTDGEKTVKRKRSRQNKSAKKLKYRTTSVDIATGTKQGEIDMQNLKCRFCEKTYRASLWLQIHEKSHETGYFECNICQEKFYNEVDFSSHCSIHFHEIQKESHESEPSGKTVCLEKFAKGSKVSLHGNIKDRPRTYICDICGKHCKTPGSYKFHHISHNRQKICRICRQHFDTVDELCLHRVTNRCTTFFKCHACGTKFMKYYGLMLHSRVCAHSKYFPCEVCNIDFPTAEAVKIHMLTHANEVPVALRKDKGARTYSRKKPANNPIESKLKVSVNPCFSDNSSIISGINSSTDTLTFHEYENKQNGKVQKLSSVITEQRSYSKKKTVNTDAISDSELSLETMFSVESFSCKACDTVFLSHEDFQLHQCGNETCTSTHSATEPNNCLGKVTLKMENLSDDEASETWVSNDKYSCKVCRTDFKSMNDLNSHECGNEGETFITSDGFIEPHNYLGVMVKMENLSNEPSLERSYLEGSSCNAYSSEFPISEGEKARQCADKMKVCISQNFPAEPYTCSKKEVMNAEIVFDGESSPEIIVSKEKYSCKQCSMEFKSLKLLRSHVLKKHKVTKHYTICGIEFRQIRELALRTLHYKDDKKKVNFQSQNQNSYSKRNRNKQAVVSLCAVSDDKSEHFPCNMCGVLLPSEELLNSHLSIHNEMLTSHSVCKLSDDETSLTIDKF